MAPDPFQAPLFAGGLHGFAAGEPVLEVLLSRDEARRGVVLPVEVPVLLPCPRCARSWLWERLSCPTCGGSGALRSVHPVNLEIPPGVRHGEQFRCEAAGGAPARFLVRVLIEPA